MLRFCPLYLDGYQTELRRLYYALNFALPARRADPHHHFDRAFQPLLIPRWDYADCAARLDPGCARGRGRSARRGRSLTRRANW